MARNLKAGKEPGVFQEMKGGQMGNILMGERANF